jgi:hypothetical protein
MISFQEPAMAIQVRCPNKDCGKILSVSDAFGGKMGRCPSCGATMQIPLADEGVQPVNRPSRSGAPRYDEDDDDDRRPVPARSRRRSRDDYDDDDDYDDRRSSRRPRYDEPRGRRWAREPFVGTLVCLGIGVGLLLFLGFVPLFSYAGISATANNITLPTTQAVPSLLKGDKDFDGGWQGKVILIVTFLVAAFVVVSLILYLTISPAVSDLVLTSSSCVAGGWCVALALWYVGFIWKVFTLARKVKEMTPNSFMGVEISLTPGVGLWLGLAIALGTVGVFSTLMTLRGKMLWIYLGEGIGLLLGLLMMLVAVQPWKIPADGLPGPGRRGGPFMQQVAPLRPQGTMPL